MTPQPSAANIKRRNPKFVASRRTEKTTGAPTRTAQEPRENCLDKATRLRAARSDAMLPTG
eukprot:CAMPEP_0183469606 /NCGR_PEP_ID=MMETSP0370-20130417/154783_1 /TAXON_ID=268820 /ORGANISM="Peridinium aciculiferum, Strain PAER-2" /LENGTH=60 /DNA_ID=CAMNT_0025662081 /DNA_START=183 /DNA_END=365 /DNA_ORIENTATION=+